ncbi:MAG: hypothetical protein ACP5N7_04040 [Candidatus Pacearchaeota archaeon]
MNDKKINKVKTVNFIGFLLFIWGIAAIIDNILKANTGIAPVLWMSYICLIILGIGILRKNSALIASQIVIIFIPYIFWNLDFFYQLITKQSLFGITDYFFRPGALSGKIIALQHIFNLPLSIYAMSLIGLNKSKFYIISFIQVTLVFIISRLVTNYDQNVNCVYRNCANFSFGLPHIVEWFVAQTLMILLTSWLLVKIFKKRK